MFQHRLKELRESMGFKSQHAFATAFGVAQSTVGGWESGAREPNHETTKKLAQFFNVPIDYLLCMPGVTNVYLTDSQQVAIYEVLDRACKDKEITQGEAIVRAQVSDNFFPRLCKQHLHQASESDILTVAEYLGVKNEVAKIIPKISMDDFSYAMHEESSHLTEEDKAMLLSMARRLREARESRNGKVK